MTHVPKNSVVERVLELVKLRPLPEVEICRRGLGIKRLSVEMAKHLAQTLLGADPRFRRLADGCWTVTDYKEKGASVSLEQATFVVVDVETTGFSPPRDRVIELGLVKLHRGHVVDEYETLVDPCRPVPASITSLTGITQSMVEGRPTFKDVCQSFLTFLGDAVFVAHNASFDWRFIQSELALASASTLLNSRLCTKAMARRLLPEIERRSLDELARFFNLRFSARHRALGDARVAAMLLLRLIERAREKDITTLAELFEYLKPRKKRN